MAEEKYANEMLSDEELDGVAGGNMNDRGLVAFWVQNFYGSNGTRGQVIDTSGNLNANEIVAKFCAKAGIDHRKDNVYSDQYEIDGQWRDISWLVANQNYVLNYFDKKLGIAK